MCISSRHNINIDGVLVQLLGCVERIERGYFDVEWYYNCVTRLRLPVACRCVFWLVFGLVFGYEEGGRDLNATQLPEYLSKLLTLLATAYRAGTGG